MAGTREKKRIKERQRKQKRKTFLPRLLAAVVLAAVVAVAVGISIAPPQYNLKAGEAAAETIKATADVVDTVTLEKLRNEAADAVKPKYIYDDEALGRVQEKYEKLTEVMKDVRTAADEVKAADTFLLFGYESAFLDIQRDKFDGEKITVTDDQLMYILDDMDTAEPDKIKTETDLIIKEEMGLGIKDDELAERKESIKSKIVAKLTEKNINPLLIEIIGTATDTEGYIVANMTYNEEATLKAKEEARESILEKDHIYKTGIAIITDGEMITEAQIAMIDELGLLDNPSEKVFLYMGLIIFTIISALLLLVYVYLCEKEIYNSMKKVVMLFTVYAFSVVLCVLFSYLNIMLMPMLVCAMMMSLLLDMNIAIVAQTLLSITAGVLAYFAKDASVITSFIIVATGIVGGGAAAYFSCRVTQRSRLFIAGVCGGAVAILANVALSLLFIGELSGLLPDVLAMIGGALLSSVICIGILPVFEIIFKEYTAMRMLELSNHSNPLLRELLQEAPGSYHHSLLVANIAENCAVEIGADVLLVRAGAYFHDVGKMKSPRFFKENQGGENPHDNLPPESSVRILNGHTTEGVAMAKKAKLPEKVIRVIQEHHGTMPATFFYRKAIDMYGENSVDIEDYRYSGPIPSCKESALIMLADASEAAVRACPDHSKEKTAEIINNIIEQRIKHGQLDNCGLSFKELRIIEESLNNTMNRLYHERIEYPPEATKAEDENKGE